MLRRRTIYGFFLLLSLMISSGCLLGEKNETSANNSNSAEEIFSPESTSTPLPKTTSITTRLTETPSPSISPTPMPTLTQGGKDALVLDLLMTNGGCQLPCWWGFTPGETEWAQAEPFLETFADSINTAGSPTSQSIDIYISISADEESNLLRHFYTVENGVIELMDVKIPENIPDYQLSNVLNNYGKPSLIFLRSGNQVWFDSLPFSVKLFYPQLNLLISYSGGDATVENDTVHICLKDTSIGLAVWSPEKDLSYTGTGEDTLPLDPLQYDLPPVETTEITVTSLQKLHYMRAAAATLRMRPSQYELPLDEATEMTITSFYETFRNPENEACLETPAELWPNP